MGLFSNALFGTPKKHEQEKEVNEVVKTPEFDITQYAKKLGLTVGILLAAAVAALKAAGVEELTDPAVLVGILAVVAVGLLSASLVMAVDLAARAYLNGESSAVTEEKEKAGSTAGDPRVVPMPRGTLVWLQGEESAHPLLAIARDAAGADSYLVASGSSVELGPVGQAQKAIGGAPKWEPAEKIRGIRPPKWS
jgi:hypothetical protein